MISEFQGEYRWLSNFAPVSVCQNGVVYPSVEHAYMSAKSDSIDWKMFCKRTKNPGAVKKASRDIQLVANWDAIKVEVMRNCLRDKFLQEPYKTLLLRTGDVHTQEGNRWGDKFWGVDLRTGKGLNTLGKLIMEIREELKEET